MNWTKEAPTRPGFYAWRKNKEEASHTFIVEDLIADRSVVTRDEFGSVTSVVEVSRLGGEWCRLVPAEEIEKAWSEGRRPFSTSCEMNDAWQLSRAKRAMEGEE